MFQRYKQVNTRHNMNQTDNKFLLLGDEFMPKIHLGQPEFIHSACAPLTKSKEGIQKFIEIGDSRYIYQNKVVKTSFQHDVAYGDFKILTITTASDKVLP